MTAPLYVAPYRTQKERILDSLRRGPVCGTELLRRGMPRYAARIYELRADGHRIETARCLLHRHDSYQIMYRLEKT